MSNDKLHGLYGKSGKINPDEEQIKALRSNLRALNDENNNIVKQIWDIAFKLNNPQMTEEQRSKLMTLNERLNQQIIDGDYINRIDEVKQQIIDLETELYGFSDLTGNSPYSI
ncbi:hypothetical protein [Legionella rowbothamii]|uniref:hypothetical protein n=1 Tax=Legionella rowbothamii TaxID=96229 RepID=UPI00105607DC|nr:hypothetical protein [Legionella rowbothamii]